jgi:putative hydrolase of the HAD superfamily
MDTVGAIFFDAVGTLIHAEPAAPVVYAEVGRRFGSRRSPEVIAERFGLAFQKQEAIDRDAGWVTSEERERRRWRAVVGDVLDDVADPLGCFDVLYGHFARPESWRCEPGAEAVFDELAARGIQLGLASNFDSRLHALVGGLRPLQLFSRHVVVSFELGFRKPAPEFFEALCERTCLAAAQVLHVGDDPGNDYAGAEAAGLAAALFDPQGKYVNWQGRRIESLEEAIAVCDRARAAGTRER